MKAAGIEVEPYWPALFAKLFAKKSMDDLITNVGAGARLGKGGGGAVAAGGAGGPCGADAWRDTQQARRLSPAWGHV